MNSLKRRLIALEQKNGVDSDKPTVILHMWTPNGQTSGLGKKIKIIPEGC